jgi:hypothetical protein
MKSIVLAFLGGLLFIAGCSKTATSDRDAFVGNYHMVDSEFSSTGVFASATKYDMQVLAEPTSSMTAYFKNIAGGGDADTASVQGTLAAIQKRVHDSYTTPPANSAVLTGNKITLSGGTKYSTNTGSDYRTGSGIKF